MDCTTEYNEKFDEILALVDLAEDTEKPLSHLQQSAICRSGLVLLCGYFEGYLREMCKEFVELINESEIIAKKLPNSILSEHALHCLEKLQRNDSLLFSDFVTALGDEGVVELNPKRFSATNANPTVDNVERLFSAFDIPLVLDSLTLEDFGITDMYNNESHVNQNMLSRISNLVSDIESRDELVTMIESKWPPKRKRRRVGYLALIDELLKNRNRIAHGEGNVSITTVDLRNATNGIRNLCTKLSLKLHGKIQDLTV